jgi:hypothetical protein
MEREVGRVSEQPFQKRDEELLRSKEEGIVIECDMTDPPLAQETHLFEAVFNGTKDKVRIESGHRAVGASKGTSFGELHDPDVTFAPLPIRQPLPRLNPEEFP